MEKKLYRSRENRMLFGVCGGIGEYTGIDPTVIRLGMIFIGFTCIGILFYIAAGLIIPEAPLYGRDAKGQGAGASPGYGSRSRREEEAFEPVAGAKPDVQTETKADSLNEVAAAVRSEPEIKPESDLNTEGFDTGSAVDAVVEPAAEASETIEQTETSTKEV